MRSICKFRASAAAATVALAAPFVVSGVLPASAQQCAVAAEDFYEMAPAAVDALYTCMKASMAEAYAQSESEVAASYRDWTVTGKRPGPDPTHGDRLLLTFANDVAAGQYLAFEEDGVDMPVGSILAKESISLGHGAAQVGPLFIMEKVGRDAAPETGGWRYSGIQPNGSTLGAPESFCQDCHGGYSGQDALAYPAPELRVAN